MLRWQIMVSHLWWSHGHAFFLAYCLFYTSNVRGVDLCFGLLWIIPWIYSLDHHNLQAYWQVLHWCWRSSHFLWRVMIRWKLTFMHIFQPLLWVMIFFIITILWKCLYYGGIFGIFFLDYYNEVIGYFFHKFQWCFHFSISHSIWGVATIYLLSFHWVVAHHIDFLIISMNV